MRIVRTLLLVFSAAAASARAAAPVWDSSGNGLLSGTYNFRQVLYTSDGSGDITQMVAYFGTIVFSPTGVYLLSNGNTLLNPAGGLVVPSTGTFSVASSGFGFLSNPLAAGTSVYFLVSHGILIGSSTESGTLSDGSFVNDLFIAAPATASFNNANFKGSYTIAGFLPGGMPAAAADVTMQLNPDGAGNLGTVNMSGYFGGGGSTPATQSDTNVSYVFASGAATLSFPTSAGANFYAGPETMYLSPDMNFVFGGSPNGFDMFVGVRNASAATTLTTGLYYEAGLDEDESQTNDDGPTVLDTYYGVFNAFGGNIIGHERLLWAGYFSAEDDTYTTTYPANVTGSYMGPTVGQLDPSGSVQYTVGAAGIRVGFGIGPYLGIAAGFPTASPTPSGAVYLDPTGVVNSASSAPFTAGISPGEFLTFYNGVNLANSSTCANALPFPTSLGSVQILIDNMPAPIYCIGSQVTVIVPYEVNAYPIASIQVVNNGASSNVATVYVRPTSPGVLSVPPGGLGFAAAEHANYSLITPANPAQRGETIAVYLVGLGSVYPPYSDGGATPGIGSIIINNVEVDVGGYGTTNIPYAGLTPGDAGLYQINFEVPSDAPAGNDALAIVGPGSYSSEALLPVGAGPGFAFVPARVKPARKRLPRLSASRP
jgi:uncharacterized protein (TIGR03437 family)